MIICKTEFYFYKLAIEEVLKCQNITLSSDITPKNLNISGGGHISQ